ncbi:MAG: hypothetical protein Kow0059_16760 [Candidatus Sumerlaeia bacterium]
MEDMKNQRLKLSTTKGAFLLWAFALHLASAPAPAQPYPSAQPDPWVDRIVSITWGNPRDEAFGSMGVVFGSPRGSTPGISGSLDVLNIGVGGEIVLAFTNNVLFDGPGPDLTIFENPFYRVDQGGAPQFDKVFCEPAFVSVSDTGTTWVTFHTDYSGPYPLPAGQYPDPDWFSGFAGIRPVFSNPSNGIDPLDPAVSGGDAFDLADLSAEAAALGVDLDNIRFVRIRDVIVNSGTDDDGDTIPAAPAAANGFDLDAVAALNWRPAADAVTAADAQLWSAFE